MRIPVINYENSRRDIPHPELLINTLRKMQKSPRTEAEMYRGYCRKGLRQVEKVLVAAGDILSLITDHSRFSSVSLPSIGQGRPYAP